MRKLNLSLDELAVESFAPWDSEAVKGTVVAHETEVEVCGGGSVHQFTCYQWHSCHGVPSCNFDRTCNLWDSNCRNQTEIECG